MQSGANVSNEDNIKRVIEEMTKRGFQCYLREALEIERISGAEYIVEADPKPPGKGITIGSRSVNNIAFDKNRKLIGSYIGTHFYESKIDDFFPPEGL
jgi:hypothetical protein